MVDALIISGLFYVVFSSFGGLPICRYANNFNMHSIRQVTMRKTKWISSLLFNLPGGHRHRHRFFHGDSQRMFTAGCCWRASASSFALVVGGGTVVFSFYDYYRQKQRDIEDQPNASRANSSGWFSSNHPTLVECAPAPPELASTPPPLFSMRNFHGNGNSSYLILERSMLAFITLADPQWVFFRWSGCQLILLPFLFFLYPSIPILPRL